MILRVKDSDRYLPIWIGPTEDDAIALKLQDVSVPRPLTHDLLRSIIATLGATVNHVIVSDLSNDTFYAKVVLQHNGTTMEVDSRPSDAIALAVRAQATIYAEDSVVEKAGVHMDKETGKPIVPGEGQEESRPPTQEELKDAKQYLTGSYALRFDTSMKIASQLLWIQIQELGIDYVDKRNALIEAILLEDVKRVAKRLLKADGLIVTIVGEPEAVAEKPAPG